MWITSLLNKLEPSLTPEDHASLLNLQRLQDLQVGLFKYGKTAPDQVISNSEDTFIELLCKSKVEMDALLRSGSAPQLQAEIEPVRMQLEQVMSQDITFAQATTFSACLNNLIEIDHEQRANAHKRRLHIRNLMLIVSILPLLGYGVHWYIGHIYQQALVD